MTCIIRAGKYASEVNNDKFFDSHLEALVASGYTRIVNPALCTQREIVYDFLPPSGSNLPTHRLVDGQESRQLYSE